MSVESGEDIPGSGDMGDWRENEEEGAVELKVPASLEFGSPGHEKEYLFQAEGLNESEQVNRMAINKALTQELGKGWAAGHRGTRIEIFNPTGKRTEEDDKKVAEAIEKVFKGRYKVSVKIY